MPEVEILRSAHLGDDRLAVLRELCDRAFGPRLTELDWQHALGGWHVVVSEAGRPVAQAAIVERRLFVGDRAFRTGYVEAVAVLPTRQSRGLGTLAMRAVGERVAARFELGALSTGRYRFYERLGWERWRGPTFARTATGCVRTADEDGGVLVLRFGPSRELDLEAPLACVERPGDDW